MATATPLPAAGLAAVDAITRSLVRTGDGDARRLAELAVEWVALNPRPVPMGEPAYRR